MQLAYDLAAVRKDESKIIGAPATRPGRIARALTVWTDATPLALHLCAIRVL